MLETLATASALMIFCALTWAAVAKAARFGQWRAALGGYGLEGRAERAASLAVPLAEALCVVLLAAGPMRAGAALSLALLAAFSLAIVRARSLQSSNDLPCGCFGGTEARDYRVMLVRNAALGVLGAIVMVGAPERGLVAQVSLARGDLLPALLVALAFLLALWMVVGVMASLSGRQHS